MNPPDQALSRYTGRLDLHLLNHQGTTVGLLEFVVRMDHITLWLGNRILMVIGRDRFRDWLTRPWRPLEQDDVVWSNDADRLTVSIDHSVSYRLPSVFAARLVEVI